MKNRREFFKSIAAAGVLGTVQGSAAESAAKSLAAPGGGLEDRAYWVSIMEKLAGPVLGSLSRGELKKQMPVETPGSAADRRRFSHLEAFGRLLDGMAPWLGASGLTPMEGRRQSQLLRLAQDSLDAATNPHSPDFMNFADGGQPIVDTAFLAQGILRAPQVLWEPLDPRVRRQIVSALKSSRVFPTPRGSNWVLFAAMIEAALLVLGETTVGERLESCLRHMLGWYKGDGLYGDGEWFHLIVREPSDRSFRLCPLGC